MYTYILTLLIIITQHIVSRLLYIYNWYFLDLDCNRRSRCRQGSKKKPLFLSTLISLHIMGMGGVGYLSFLFVSFTNGIEEGPCSLKYVRELLFSPSYFDP